MKIFKLTFFKAATVAFVISNSAVVAKPLNIFFGTGSRGSEGIYQATFNPENGKFSPSNQANIGSP